jgi:hypothetical protein
MLILPKQNSTIVKPITLVISILIIAHIQVLGQKKNIQTINNDTRFIRVSKAYPRYFETTHGKP